MTTKTVRGLALKVSITCSLALVIASLAIPLSMAVAHPNPTEPTATETVSQCPQQRPSLFDEIRSPLAKAALPEKVLLAREANLWVENPRTGLRIWARHNFKTGKKSFVCADVPAKSESHLSVPMVVLWDRTKEAKTGDSLWQMQVMANKSKLGLWSQKTGLMTVRDLLNARTNPWKFEFTDGVLDETILRSASRQGDVNLTAVIRLDHAD